MRQRWGSLGNWWVLGSVRERASESKMKEDSQNQSLTSKYTCTPPAHVCVYIQENIHSHMHTPAHVCVCTQENIHSHMHRRNTAEALPAPRLHQQLKTFIDVCWAKSMWEAIFWKIWPFSYNVQYPVDNMFSCYLGGTAGLASQMSSLGLVGIHLNPPGRK